MNTDRKLRKLDDRITELWRCEQWRLLGRMEGENMERARCAYYRGQCPEPPEYERTPESRLQKHLEREHQRLCKEAGW